MLAVEYTVLNIDGDYAVLVDGRGGENRVARALLPPDADEGTRLLWDGANYDLIA